MDGYLLFQVVPIPQIEVNELKEVFREHAELQSMQFTDIPTNTDLKQVIGQLCDRAMYI